MNLMSMQEFSLSWEWMDSMVLVRFILALACARKLSSSIDPHRLCSGEMCRKDTFLRSVFSASDTCFWEGLMLQMGLWMQRGGIWLAITSLSSSSSSSTALFSSRCRTLILGLLLKLYWLSPQNIPLYNSFKSLPSPASCRSSSWKVILGLLERGGSSRGLSLKLASYGQTFEEEREVIWVGVTMVWEVRACRMKLGAGSWEDRAWEDQASSWKMICAESLAVLRRGRCSGKSAWWRKMWLCLEEYSVSYSVCTLFPSILEVCCLSFSFCLTLGSPHRNLKLAVGVGAGLMHFLVWLGLVAFVESSGLQLLKILGGLLPLGRAFSGEVTCWQLIIGGVGREGSGVGLLEQWYSLALACLKLNTVLVVEL